MASLAKVFVPAIPPPHRYAGALEDPGPQLSPELGQVFLNTEQISEALADAVDLGGRHHRLDLRHDTLKALGVKQKKLQKKLRIMLEVDGVESGLGALIRKILARNAQHGSPYLLLTEKAKRVTAAMLRHRWDDAREEAVKETVAAGDQVLAGRISQFQFRDIRPSAASEIVDVDHASVLLGHTKGDITERVYRRVGALAKPTR